MNLSRKLCVVVLHLQPLATPNFDRKYVKHRDLKDLIAERSGTTRTRSDAMPRTSMG